MATKAKVAQVNISVTKKHIEKGKRGDCGKCPIALALLDAGFKAVSVGGGAYVMSPRSKWQFKLETNAADEKSIRNFVEHFDSGRKAVEPFKFKATAPVSLLQRVKYTGKYKEVAA